MTLRIGLYPGSFDPFTFGHLDILRKAAALFDTVVVGIGIHPGKQPLLTFEERKGLIEVVADAEGFRSRVVVESFGSLVVEAAVRFGASTLIRGLRDGTDLDYEMQMAGMNAALQPDIGVVFLPSSPVVRPITATLVRQIAAMGGDVAPFVPAAVAEMLRAKKS